MNRFLLLFSCLLFSLTVFGQINHPVGCHHPPSEYEPAPGFSSMMLMDDMRSDSIDILNYEINVDVSTAPNLIANTIVTATPKIDNIDEIVLDLLMLEIDSIFVDGQSMDFTYDGFQMFVDLPQVYNTGEDFQVHVYYHGLPIRDPSGFGGLVTESGYIYNLGIGIASNPHNFGRGWFPCFDNFMERSTYDINITHSGSFTAHAVGTEIGIVTNDNNTKTTSYVMDQEITTYQTSIAVSNYESIWSVHEGMAGPIPIKLMSKPQDTTAMKGSMGHLPATLDCIEGWYGPYAWERVGYVATTVGAMEHPTNIAYPTSSINGNPNTNLRLMSHELTHNWFGNVITLSTERDMWIKEGPAEYGAHLSTECIFGYEEFLEQVKDNHLYVLERAHTDDNGFRALSGMPNEYTYGTHTYRKGASVIHNIRGYLGDDLFRTGMQSILKTYEYSHLDAEEFQDELTSSTGVDMKDFFDGWILNPGFSVFVDDSIGVTDNGNGTWDTKIYGQQKLRGTDFFHKSVPLTVHAYGYNNEVEEFQVMLSGQYDEATIQTSFDVKRITFNKDNVLNQARMADDQTVESTGSLKFDRTGITFKVEEVSEPFPARVEHIWGQPDQNIVEGDYEITQFHYWRIDGDFPSDYEIGVNFKYDGKSSNDLDFPLSKYSEDSILLFYRPDASLAWEPVPDVNLKKVIPTDGAGVLELANILPGEYTIGKGVINSSSVNNEEIISFTIVPNPASDIVYVYPENGSKTKHTLRMYDLSGQLLATIPTSNSEFISINVQSYAAGTYLLELTESKTGKKNIQKVAVVK